MLELSASWEGYCDAYPRAVLDCSVVPSASIWKGLQLNRIILSALITFTITTTTLGAATAAMIENGDLNIISDFGNPSDGLAYLDLSYSEGLTQAAALANAQLSYANARIATPDEFDDLFLAAGISYSSSYTASSAFNSGGELYLVNGPSAPVLSLVDVLGSTATFHAGWLLWTDPDGSMNGTRDYLSTSILGAVATRQSTALPPSSDVAWLIVTPIPEPSTGILVALGLLGLGITSRRPAVRMNIRKKAISRAPWPTHTAD